MGNALISRRGGGYSTVKFENYGNNLTLSKSYAPDLSYARSRMGATTVGDYALFAGGNITNSSTFYSTVDTYTSSLTKSTATSLSRARSELAATTVAGWALFGGGYSSGPTYHSTVDVYNNVLTRTTASSLPYSMFDVNATTVGDYALFGGGVPKNSSEDSSYVTAYKRPSTTLYVYNDSKYKFQNMDSEQTYSSTMGTISIPCPATGYIKFKNTTIS